MTEEKFQDVAALEAWLIEKQVPVEFATEAAPILFGARYLYPSTLIGISFGPLTRAGISDPVARSLSNKLEKQEQQQHGKLRCCFCILVFNVLFEYGFPDT
jgi:hypothetical protein